MALKSTLKPKTTDSHTIHTILRRARDIPAAMINIRIGVAENLGANREVMLKEAKIDTDIFANPKVTIINTYKK